MLFNSLTFILVFLPVCLCLYTAAATYSSRAAVICLTVCSIAFYSLLDQSRVTILLGSAGANFFAGLLVADAHLARNLRKAILATFLAANLVVLCYFKYLGFAAEIASDLFGSTIAAGQVLLPVGISFFTFTQIAYLVDCYRSEISEHRVWYYILFVTYLPHLIAGPIIHHNEMMPQFNKARRPALEDFALGLTIFVVGLSKKTIIADSVGAYVSHVFDVRAPDTLLSFGDGWLGALSYTAQIYFDFSGYTDMALGISLWFTFRLPLNFYSPYQATSIIEFWRRWHMTLSRFLRDYVYIPLGGNRCGELRRYGNILATMLLGGLWHGAGWTFVVWGGLHGVYLVLNHVWRRAQRFSTPVRFLLFRSFVSWFVTFLAVVIAWVFFRAHTMLDAFEVLSAMFGAHGMSFPGFGADARELVASWHTWLNIDLANPTGTNIAARVLDMYVSFGRVNGGRVTQAILVGAALAAATLMPNIYRVIGLQKVALVDSTFLYDDRATRRQWRPSFLWAVATGLLLALAIVPLLNFDAPKFLYFTF